MRKTSEYTIETQNELCFDGAAQGTAGAPVGGSYRNDL